MQRCIHRHDRIRSILRQEGTSTVSKAVPALLRVKLPTVGNFCHFWNAGLVVSDLILQKKPKIWILMEDLSRIICW